MPLRSVVRFPGVWWDEAAEFFHGQSEKFFAAYKRAGGELDEVMQVRSAHHSTHQR